MVDVDIDIWGYGREPLTAGRITLRAMKAHYPYVGPINDPALWIRLTLKLPDYYEPNFYDQRVWMLLDRHIFFTNREDAELCRALQYVV